MELTRADSQKAMLSLVSGAVKGVEAVGMSVTRRVIHQPLYIPWPAPNRVTQSQGEGRGQGDGVYIFS